MGAGEIVGIAGVEGNGQRTLEDAIAGVSTYTGSIRLDDGELAPGDPAARIARGIRTIARDRRREGLIGDWSFAENVTLGDQRRAPLRRGLALDRRAARERARDVIARFDVRAPSPEARAAVLSGGNQQKLLAGRALAVMPRLLLAAQPTRGIDVAAAASCVRA